MTFDEKIILAVDDIPVPDCLSPANIENMLRSKRTARRASENTNKKPRIVSGRTASVHSTTDHASTERPVITVSRNSRRDAAFKITAAVAACFVLLTGVLIYRGGGIVKPGIDDIVKYADIPAPLTPSSYSELYDVYTALRLDGMDTASSGDKEIAFDFSRGDTDIVKTDGGMIYTLWNGTLYIIGPDSSEIIGTVNSKAHPPAEMYVNGGNLFLISSIDSNDVYVEIYDVTKPSSPLKVSDYSQCGGFTSGKVIDEKLVLVSTYSDYRLAPLDGDTDLAGFVPEYTVNGDSFYVDADNIYVPANAASTDYTVVSSIDCKNPGNISVKAVLGSGGDVYCTANSLYVFGKGQDSYSIISKFDLTSSFESGSFKYAGSLSVDGLIPDSRYLNEDSGNLRVITTAFDETGSICENVYLLSSDMSVLSTAGGVLTGEIIDGVKFADGFVFFYINASESPALVINTRTTPMSIVPELSAVTGDIYSYGGNLLGFSKTQSGYRLALYDTSGKLLNELSFSTYGDKPTSGRVFSAADTDTRAIYIDEDGFVGVPVYSFDEFGTSNQYFIFRIENGTITEQTTLRYIDIDDSNIFERALKIDGNLDVIGGGRIVKVRMSDWKVISVKDLLVQ